MIIAIDVGGTKISAALMDNDEIIELRKIESVIHTDLINLAQHLFNLCKGWVEQSEQLAIACTGQVGADYVNFLSAKQRLPLKSQLEALFKLPVVIINDAAAAAWAEYCIGKIDKSATRVEDILVYITVSTGIGGGVIQNGQLVTSNDGFCAHLGHVSVLNSKRELIQCHCGRINCAEAISSGTAISKQASEILGKTVTCKEVFQDHLSNDMILQLIDKCSSAVTDLIANIKAITGTDIVILGGSVGCAPYFVSQVRDKLEQLPEIYQLTIKSPKCGSNADLIGAYYFAKQNS